MPVRLDVHAIRREGAALLRRAHASRRSSVSQTAPATRPTGRALAALMAALASVSVAQAASLKL